MTDWSAIVRRHLAGSELTGDREAEIVAELAQLLEDASTAEQLDPDSAVAVEAFLRREVPEWSVIRRELRAQNRDAIERSPAATPWTGVGGRGTRGSRLAGLTLDLRVAWRLLVKNPGFTAAAVITLALGVGLNSAMFSLVNYMLLKPLPVEAPGELVRVFSSEPDGFLPQEPMSYLDYLDVRDGVGAFSSVLAFTAAVVVVEGEGEPRVAMGELASGNYFSTLGLRPAVGRFFNEADDDPGSPTRVAVLGHGAWQTMFGGTPDVLGEDLRVNGHLLTIIGVAPPTFRGLWPVIEPMAWIPLSLSPEIDGYPLSSSGNASDDLNLLENRSMRWLWVIGRLATGATFASADAEVATLSANLREAFPDTNEARAFLTMPSQRVRIVPAVDSGIRTGSMVLMSVVGLVLLIASANVANMLLARGLARRAEMATRLSLGASRGRLVRQMLLESLMLGGLGAGAGLAIAWTSNAVFNRIQIPTVVPLRVEISLDLRVVLFTSTLAMLAALVFGMAPALAALKTDLTSATRTQGGGGGRGGQRLQKSLVVAQVCFSMVLLVCAGLSLRSLMHANRIDPGFVMQGAVTATVDPSLQGYDEAETLAFYRRLDEALARIPGVTRAAYASHLPLSLAMNTNSIVPQGQESLPQREWPEIDGATVSAGYFEAMGIALLEGRDFLAGDTPDQPSVAVINRTLAERFWPGQSAIGRRIISENYNFEVIGVVRDGKYRTLGESPRPFIYRSIDQSRGQLRVAIVRFDRPDLVSVDAVRHAIRSEGPHLAISNLDSLEQAVTVAFMMPRYGARLFGLFGLLGLFLAAIGLYGVMAYMVNQRTREIGIRVAMGARPGDILRLVLRQGIFLTLVGALLGVPLAFGATRLLGAMLYGAAAGDPATFIIVFVALLAAALVACLVPARRAVAVAPIKALRFE